MVTVLLHPDVARGLCAGIAEIHGLQVVSPHQHWNEMDELTAELRREHGVRAPSDIAGLAPARTLYKTFGVDPTRTRPSSEALLRRVLQNKELYRVSSLVDVTNWVSLRILLPIGLYDLDATQGDLELRLGKTGELFAGIRRADIQVEGRLVVADASGACGSPTADSLRTSVRETTRNVVAVLFAPAGYPEHELLAHVELFARKVVAWCGGEVRQTHLLGFDGARAVTTSQS